MLVSKAHRLKQPSWEKFRLNKPNLNWAQLTCQAGAVAQTCNTCAMCPLAEKTDLALLCSRPTLLSVASCTISLQPLVSQPFSQVSTRLNLLTMPIASRLRTALP